MTTIVDIAKQAGVSFKTVSRVMNGEASVRPTTREKVLKAAKDLNYSANTAARNLRSKRPRMVALLINNPSQSYSQSVQLGALMGCQKFGLFLSLHSKADEETLTELANSNRFAGCILAPPFSDDLSVLSKMTALGLPIIRLGTEHPEAMGIRISVDDHQAAFDMTEHLLSLGHKSIGFIKGHKDYEASAHRFGGFQDALAKANIKLNIDHVAQGDFSYESGLNAAETLLKAPSRPTAIFASNDEMAAGSLAAAYKMNIRVPRMLSIAGFDDSAIASAVYPSLTTIEQALPAMVERAVEILSGHGQPYVSVDQTASLILEHRLIARNSTGPAPQS
jgi:LacI family transcriptional regulator